jgi:hypothetical protein
VRRRADGEMAQPPVHQMDRCGCAWYRTSVTAVAALTSQLPFQHRLQQRAAVVVRGRYRAEETLRCRRVVGGGAQEAVGQATCTHFLEE